jgi:SAM-dependent methyltransferase
MTASVIMPQTAPEPLRLRAYSTRHQLQKKRKASYAAPTRYTPYNIRAITAQTIERLSVAFEDKTNLTNVSRSFKTYLALTSGGDSDTNPASFLKERSHFLGRKLVVLDSGCGEGKAMKELLTSSKYKPYVKSCIGISLHYFKKTANLLAKHPKTFELYLGKSEQVLPSLSKKADLIVDVWAAYSYSKERSQLLKLYHQTLQPGGKAFIYYQPGTTVSKPGAEREVNFEESLSSAFPGTFSCHMPKRLRGSKSVLVITKNSLRFPSIKHEIRKVTEECSISREGRSTMELAAGNAIFPEELSLTETTPRYILRPLPYLPRETSSIAWPNGSNLR